MLASYLKELTYCTFCPKLCKLVCPVAVGTGREDFTPTSKMQFAYFVLKGMSNFDDPSYNEVFYQCTTCTACTNYCDHDIDVANILLEVRREIAGRGILPMKVAQIRDNVLKNGGSPYPDHPRIKEKWKKFLLPEAQVVLFPGFTAMNEYRALVDHFFSFMSYLGIDYIALFDTFFSSGYPLYTLGFQQEFVTFAASLYRELSKFKLIITLDPTDAWIFKIIYGNLGFKLTDKVLTVDEFLNKNFALLKEKFPEPVFKAYSYHDPCYLGRYASLYELPRKLLSLVFEDLVENPWTKSNSFCCGRGGMYFLTDPEHSREIARERKSHFTELNIDAVVTSCPGGVIQLRNVGKRMKVWHIIDAFYNAMMA